jgi:hypothetical protein
MNRTAARPRHLEDNIEQIFSFVNRGFRALTSAGQEANDVPDDLAHGEVELELEEPDEDGIDDEQG